MYASWVLYAGILGITWYYCYPIHVYYLAIFTITLILLYQALFQFHADTFYNIVPSLIIAVIITVVSALVYYFWNVNYFTAGLLLTSIYNFCWNILLHRIKKTLTPEVFVEQLVFLLLLLVMIFGVTNFKEKIDRCSY
jgi:drug/metabolite transporter (DMT)-like permease